MQRSSNKIGALAAALDEAQSEIANPDKSMTATIAARLVADGAVRFETTLTEAFPELVPWMQPGYRAVTLEALLAHRSGIPQVPPVAVPLRGDPARARAGAAGDPGPATAGSTGTNLPLLQSRLHRGRHHAGAAGAPSVRGPGGD